jgi:hypothetical protein
MASKPELSGEAGEPNGVVDLSPVGRRKSDGFFAGTTSPCMAQCIREVEQMKLSDLDDLHLAAAGLEATLWNVR